MEEYIIYKAIARGRERVELRKEGGERKKLEKMIKVNDSF